MEQIQKIINVRRTLLSRSAEDKPAIQISCPPIVQLIGRLYFLHLLCFSRHSFAQLGLCFLSDG